VFIFFYGIAFSLSLGPIVWLYDAEILPDAGLALSTFTNWLFAAVIG